jgi:hypothetical protein
LFYFFRPDGIAYISNKGTLSVKMTNCNRDIKKEEDNDLESQEELRAFNMPFYHTYSKGC